MKCTIQLCENETLAKEMCSKHYYRVKRHGTPYAERKKRSKCQITDCVKQVVTKKLCPKHFKRLTLHGDPNFINPKCNRDGKYRERHKLYQKQWRKDNWEYYKAYLQVRKKRIKQSIPKWQNKSELIAFYQKCPKNCHVDHIVPVLGKIVSGLTVLCNLQYLPSIENLRKGNKFK